ncbi:hypothetical protein BCR32DRAFT_244556 [Anaeromyces robustus]|uniref:Uncharacterized protein n=1 Tax=Anaeromyces robustus TaxID=1754192 RepID=A0A1Y1X9B3_9FUNG|nr:hypothetical protein BCR32DRAFT_244556 [Anaeromyces robustus]|eukprot:ORX81934.1 hypothetical protein BCR32DRAFT_244556 [Anaeromyces robustus]
MNEFKPQPPLNSKNKTNVDDDIFENNVKKETGPSKCYYDAEDLLKMNIDLKKKINILTKDRNKLITEIRSSEENRARWEQKCHDIIRTTANTLSLNLKKIIHQNKKEISALEDEINTLKSDIRYTRLNEMEILRLNRILQMVNTDSDSIIDLLNDKKKYEQTIEELNEKIETYEKNNKIMEENLKDLSNYKDDNEILIEKFYIMREKLENLNKDYNIAMSIIQNQKKKIMENEKEIIQKNKKIDDQKNENQLLISKNEKEEEENKNLKKKILKKINFSYSKMKKLDEIKAELNDQLIVIENDKKEREESVKCNEKILLLNEII